MKRKSWDIFQSQFTQNGDLWLEKGLVGEDEKDKMGRFSNPLRAMSNLFDALRRK